MKWLRLHLIDNEVVDLNMEGITEAQALEVSMSPWIHGEHVGGNLCAIPKSSLIWAEVIEAPAEVDDGEA